MEGEFLGWHPTKGYGKIRPDDGSGVVMLFKNDAPGLENIREKTRLSFDVIENADSKKSARNARLLTGTTTGKIGRGTVKLWIDERKFGFITPESGSRDVFVHLSQIPDDENGYLSPGLEVEYHEIEGGDGRSEAHSVRVIGWSKPDESLLGFADMGESGWLEALATLAEPEPWHFDGSKEEQDSLPILRSYIFHTFRRLSEMEDGIRLSKDKMRAATNTGLVTRNQEEIFALFRKNNKTGRQEWKLSGFRKASNWEITDHFGSKLPPLADYFEDPSVLLYDRRCDLIINYDHVMENIDRFPKELQGNPYMARQLLTSAEGNTKKRVYRNYKTAIPQFYRDNRGYGGVQLLLPICLTDPAKADLALVVEKSDISPVYRASTILTLEMAYKNARLLTRPDNEWLRP